MNLICTAFEKTSVTGSVDLNEAGDRLGVSKRRLYDITNIIEGVGILKKISMNQIEWYGIERVKIFRTCNGNDDGILDLEDLAKKRKNNIHELDRLIHKLQGINREIVSGLYCTISDVRKSIQDEDRDTEGGTSKSSAFIIGSPPGSVLEIPYAPEEQYRKIYISNKGATVAAAGTTSRKRRISNLHLSQYKKLVAGGHRTGYDTKFVDPIDIIHLADGGITHISPIGVREEKILEGLDLDENGKQMFTEHFPMSEPNQSISDFF